MRIRLLVVSAALLLASVSSIARDYQAGDILIDRPYARATMPGQTSGAAYLTLENKSKNADRLVAITSPAAKSVQMHTMSMEGNVMKMREVPHIEIKPAAKLTMKPGEGIHIMLIGIAQPLKPGDKIPLTLTFESAGKTEVTAIVEDKAAGKDKAHHHRH